MRMRMRTRALSRRALLASLTSSVAASAMGRTAYGGRLRMAVPWPITSLEPASLSDGFSALFAAACCEPLYALDSSDNPYPALADLPPDVAAALEDPLLPIDLDLLPPDGRGLLWVFMSSWAALYGTVTLEVFGHLDPRIIESGAMFAAMVHDQMERLGMDAERERLEALLAAELARQ